MVIVSTVKSKISLWVKKKRLETTELYYGTEFNHNDLPILMQDGDGGIDSWMSKLAR